MTDNIPTITFEFRDGKHVAHVTTAESRHHGSGDTPDQALSNAVAYWHAYKEKQREIEKAEPCPACATGRLVTANGGGVVCHAKCGYWFCY